MGKGNRGYGENLLSYRVGISKADRLSNLIYQVFRFSNFYLHIPVLNTSLFCYLKRVNRLLYDSTLKIICDGVGQGHKRNWNIFSCVWNTPVILANSYDKTVGKALVLFLVLGER
jgi:hypothetical protein